MIIHLAEHYGLCFGVRDAIAHAERLAAEGPLTILGELAHNPLVQARLAALGVTQGALDAPAPTARVLITAHGASDAARERWRAAGHLVEDATCPLVRLAHAQLARLVQAGYHPVIIGRASHVEVQGLAGDFQSATILEASAGLASIPARPRYGVISQTTQPIARVRSLAAALRELHPRSEVRFCDTVCRPTKDRQEAMERLLREVELVIVVGGRNSNNTRELVRRARDAGLPVHHIERPEELRREWFEGVAHAGITGGTSTLPETVAAVRRRVEELAATL